MTKILDNGYFPFSYNKDKIKTGEEDFPEPEWTVYDFFHNKIIAVKAKIYSLNFKMPSQSHAACNNFFCL